MRTAKEKCSEVNAIRVDRRLGGLARLEAMRLSRTYTYPNLRSGFSATIPSSELESTVVIMRLAMRAAGTCLFEVEVGLC
jgi:hypothetical protein